VHEEAFRSGRHGALEDVAMVLDLAIARGPVILWMAGSRSGPQVPGNGQARARPAHGALRRCKR
jgi:hypothetical protein